MDGIKYVCGLCQSTIFLWRESGCPVRCGELRCFPCLKKSANIDQQIDISAWVPAIISNGNEESILSCLAGNRISEQVFQQYQGQL